MADTLGSGPSERKLVGVRIPPSADFSFHYIGPHLKSTFHSSPPGMGADNAHAGNLIRPITIFMVQIKRIS